MHLFSKETTSIIPLYISTPSSLSNGSLLYRLSVLFIHSLFGFQIQQPKEEARDPVNHLEVGGA